MYQKRKKSFTDSFYQLCGVFIIVSALIYGIHYLIFRDSYYIFKILIAQLGFLPISTFLVTAVLNKLLSIRQGRERLNKLNMVIGTFFSETGNELLYRMNQYIGKEFYKQHQEFQVTQEWTEKEFADLKNQMQDKQFMFHLTEEDIANTKEFLLHKRNFLLNLLQNPTLLEHQSFTELLQAVFHLTEELVNRKELEHLSKDDIEHIQGDFSRVYHRLLVEWICYLEHLQQEYPYLFSLAVRTNPWQGLERKQAVRGFMEYED